MAHIASGALKPGALLTEYRAFAKELLTNPQVVARAYADLEWEGVLKKASSGSMEVAAGAATLCRVRLQNTARQRLRDGVTQARGWGLPDDEIRKTVEQSLAAQTRPLSQDEILQAITTASHASSHRAPQDIQVLSGQEGGGPAEPERPAGGDFRVARG
jgi:DNA-binding transcriptional regulator YhcF (GntR family)